MVITTLKLSKETKERLEKLREHKRESYDEILRKMLGILNMAKLEPEKARSILNKIDEVRNRFEKESKDLDRTDGITRKVVVKKRVVRR